MAYAGVEQEAILLKAVWDMIDDMVNLEVFQYPVTSRPTNLVFKSGSHKRIFAILLADFLAQPRQAALPFAFGPSGQATRETDRTYLFYLEAICRQPQFGAEASGLAAAASSFADWLNAECHCPAVWLPELDLSLDLRVSRVWMLKVVGDANKHNFSRLDARVKQIKAMLARHGHVVDEGMVYRALPNFQDWFYTDVFSYHASTIGEFLDQIRRALFDYLSPEYARAWRSGDRFDGDYSFDVPTQIRDPLALGMYWELMNRVRGGLWFPTFSVSPLLKNRF
ncbi:MAG: hypothetical protein B7Z42_07115 [Brevundimonas sp. 12-68-7]|uniref:Uncharacterized protein n=1 Tax=Brevundimonas subvibrioides TaxID=74313 RepID=A0A258FLC2_9CAUL|nr:MAG: hypothetical protein B7Z42_07115 [Brevundimonas sp. 12-68-7]OYX32653.1 MAG: hypothetical protein B7Z01_10860 [Brevundimonas subvibrioides]